VFVSRSLPEASRGSTRLYRRALKSIPMIVRTYRLPYDAGEIRRRIRFDFESHGHVTDPAMVDMIVFKGENELEEVTQNWATRGHVLNYFIEMDARKQRLDWEHVTDEEKQFLATVLEQPPTSRDSFRKFT